MKTFYITRDRRLDPIPLRMHEGDIETINFDLRAYEEDNGTVTTVTWESGTLGVTNKTLTSQVASGNISASQTGRYTTKVTFDTGTLKTSRTLRITVVDETLTNDYPF